MPRFGKQKDDVLRVVAVGRVDASSADHAALLATMERCNEAANWLAGEAFAARCADFVQLRDAHYRELRGRFGLSSQTANMVAAKVVGAYKRDLGKRPTFRPRGSIAFDPRLYTVNRGVLSIRALAVRLKGIPLRLGPAARAWLDHGAWKEADLTLRSNGTLLLSITVELKKPDPKKSTGTLGVDLGIVNLTVDSDGNVSTGAKVDEVRDWYAARRAALQKVGTRSATRALRKLAGREARFKRNENHRIAKQAVARAQGTGRRIALEDLGGIRRRVTVRHTQRSRHASWSFRQLRAFLTYKAALAGVPLVIVDPRGTSTTCPLCEHRDRRNRRSQAEFCCRRCGYAAPADWNAAVNIRNRADVSQPMVSHHDA